MYKAKKKRGHTMVYIFIGILVIGVSLIYAYYKNSLKPVLTSDKESINLEIPAGSSSKTIGKILEENDLIRNQWVFLLRAKALDTDSYLKAGQYKLSKSMDLDTIINSLIKGGKSGNTISFTIPEGYEIKDIARKLDKEGIVNSDKFLKLAGNKEYFEEEFEFLKQIDDGQSLEGFLFPSTYEIFEYQKEEDVIKKMLQAFENLYEKAIKTKIEDMDFDLNDIITLASIVEREAKLDQERTIISAVFHNRLKTNMNLQSCATVQYILGERKEVLSIAETRIDSPFNTYINNGLPPSPIASPGEKSLIAAINPDDVDYLFFRLKDDDGSHVFTRTFQEHKDAAIKK